MNIAENYSNVRLHILKPIAQSNSHFGLGYERVYLPLCEMKNTPFHIKDDVLFLHMSDSFDIRVIQKHKQINNLHEREFILPLLHSSLDMKGCICHFVK